MKIKGISEDPNRRPCALRTHLLSLTIENTPSVLWAYFLCAILIEVTLTSVVIDHLLGEGAKELFFGVVQAGQHIVLQCFDDR